MPRAPGPGPDEVGSGRASRFNRSLDAKWRRNVHASQSKTLRRRASRPKPLDRGVQDLSKVVRTAAIGTDLLPTLAKANSIVGQLDIGAAGLADPKNRKALALSVNAQFDPAEARAATKALGASFAFGASRPPAVALGLPLASERIAALFRTQQGLTRLQPAWLSRVRQMARGISEFIEEQQRMDEQADEFVRKHGWPIPLHLPVRAFRQIAGLAESGKREVNGFMQRSFRPGTRAFRVTEAVLLESPQMESRRPILRQALSAHRRRQWYLVINALLPQVEGVLVDYAYEGAIPPRSGRKDKALRRLTDQESRSLGITVDTLEALLSAGTNVALYGGFDPTRYGSSGEPRHLNRDAILHGASRRYGSERNALRLVLLLAVMAEGFDLANGG
jgi:hypothetical protein